MVNKIIKYEQNFKKIIEEIKRIKSYKTNKLTFMEISKYPHYENVCSNILDFFFKDDEGHNLNNVLIKSILNIIDKNKNYDLNICNSFREYVTSNGNRIDLVLEYGEFTITIENKIYAKLDNDLNDYKNTINNKYKDKKNYFIILSLNEIKSEKFINVTYEKFINEVNKKLKSNVLNNNNKYLIYLEDFLKTITNLKMKKKIEDEMSSFLLKNERNITLFWEEIEKVKNIIKTEIVELKDYFNKNELKDFIIYDGNDYSLFTTTLYTTINLKNINIGLDINRDFNEWYICIFSRKSKDNDKFLKIVEQKLKKYNKNVLNTSKIKNPRLIIIKFEKNIKIDEIFIATKEIINKFN